jgi:hypothetical protein
MFDLPKADKCLLAFGELDVHLYECHAWICVKKKNYLFF